MYLEYSTHFMLFFSPHVAFALEAFVHLYAAAKKTLFSIQSNKKSVNLGPCQFFFITKHLVNILPIYLSQHEIIYMEEFWKSEEFVWNI